MAESSVITYEVLYELLRNEKKNDDLQKLDPDMMETLVTYIRTKVAMYKKEAENPDLTEADRENSKNQINNVRKLIKELLEKRQKKIADLAYLMSVSKESASPAVAENILQGEKELLTRIENALSDYRKSVILNIINARPAAAMPDEAPAAQIQAPMSISGVGGNRMIRFVIPVPQFVGDDLQVYGPFMEGEIANLPREVADVIVLKKRAEPIDPKV